VTTGTAVEQKALQNNTFRHLASLDGIVGFRFESRWGYFFRPYSYTGFRDTRGCATNVQHGAGLLRFSASLILALRCISVASRAANA
jgi:hypothetical protein